MPRLPHVSHAHYARAHCMHDLLHLTHVHRTHKSCACARRMLDLPHLPTGACAMMDPCAHALCMPDPPQLKAHTLPMAKFPACLTCYASYPHTCTSAHTYQAPLRSTSSHACICNAPTPRACLICCICCVHMHASAKSPCAHACCMPRQHTAL